jgi:hypothetical protein
MSIFRIFPSQKASTMISHRRHQRTPSTKLIGRAKSDTFSDTWRKIAPPP